MQILARAYYLEESLQLAPKLLGKILVHELPEGTVKARIVETEAYMGEIDKAAHTYGGRRTPRTAVQFQAGGLAYVYLIYGMYSCMNIVAAPPERPHCVLLRALEPLEGIEIMQRRRKVQLPTQLCSGPGKLCDAMGIDRSCNGLDLSQSKLYLQDAPLHDGEEIEADVRINIGYAEEARDFPWRFFIKENPHVSVKPKRTAQQRNNKSETILE